jgi:hypothetical protein
MLARGLRGKVRCRHSCKVVLIVSVPRKVARRLHTKTTLVKRTIRITGTRSTNVKLTLSRKTGAALELANPATVAVTLRGTATAPTSRTSRGRRSIRIVR